MSSEVSLRIHNLAKSYLIYGKPEDRLKQMILRWRRYYREFWALKGIELEVYRGETVGILGRNGSGKTTMLEMVAGTLTPTAGDVEVHGKVAALLGLGAGFNPEFSGRENVILNATLLGLSSKQVHAVFDRIAAFADIGDFIDRPVKTYSSGMYSRLAFAVAIHVDPDILIVDETLSVGDEAFQRKCFSRINELKESGCTILFVTHSANTVVELCDRAVLLDHGERLLVGSPRTVVAQYQRLVHAPDDKAAAVRAEIQAMDGRPEAMEQARVASAPPQPAALPPSDINEPVLASEDGDEEAFLSPHLTSESLVEYPSQGARISDIRVETPSGRRVNHLTHEHDYDFVYRITFETPQAAARCGMQIRAVNGVVLVTQTSHLEHEGFTAQAGDEIEVRFPFRALLYPGTYFLNAGVAVNDSEKGAVFLHRLVDAYVIRIMPRPAMTAGGMVNIQAGRAPRIAPLAATAP